MKVILCMCPNCNNISRLSDFQISLKGKIPKTWLDEYELNLRKLEQKEEKFGLEEKKIREIAIARGRKQVPKLIRKYMDEKLSKLKYDPYDIKALLHPIDFVVFNGMNRDQMKDIVLLSRTTSNPNLTELHKGIAKVVSEKSYDWKVLRVSDDGQVDYE